MAVGNQCYRQRYSAKRTTDIG